MNWDNLLTPLLFLLFIGVPLLNRLNRSKGTRPKPGSSTFPDSTPRGPITRPPRKSPKPEIQETPATDLEFSRQLAAARR